MSKAANAGGGGGGQNEGGAGGGHGHTEVIHQVVAVLQGGHPMEFQIYPLCFLVQAVVVQDTFLNMLLEEGEERCYPDFCTKFEPLWLH